MSGCTHACSIEPVRADGADADAPDLLARAAAAPAGVAMFYWERPAAGEAMLGVGCAHDVRTSGPARLGEAAREVRRVLASTEISAGTAVEDGAGSPRFVGGFAFAPDDPPVALWREFPSCRLFLPRRLWTRDGGRTHLSTCTPCTAEFSTEAAVRPQRAGACRGPSQASTVNGGESRDVSGERDRWRRRVQRVLSMVAQGAVEKVVLSRSRTLEESSARPGVVEVVERLRGARPGCYTFWIRGGETDFIGSTPELLVGKRGDTIETQAIAGTARRGDSVDEDRELARRLADSGKDRREQQAVTRAIGEILAPLTVRLEMCERPEVMRLPEAFHLHTPIRGRLRLPISALELAGMLHPTPAVCGLPQRVALDLLVREERERGWYTGAVGWLGQQGDGAFAVALRSALFDGARTTLWAGAGIVAGSDPAAEYDETELKMGAIGAALSRGGR